MARLAVILAVILSLFVLSHGRLPLEPTTTATATTSSESATDADREPSKTLDPTAYVVPINQIGDGSLSTGEILRHIDFSLRRPFHHRRHHSRHFHGHRRHRMREMEIALGADAIGFPGDRIPLRSGEEKGLVKEEEEEIKGENPMKEEMEEIEKREGDSDSDSDDEEEEKMEKRKRKCKKHKKRHHLHHFRHHRHHRDEEVDGEKSGLMQRFWDFLNHF